MTKETNHPDAPAEAEATKRRRRPKPGPGRHGAGKPSVAAAAEPTFAPAAPNQGEGLAAAPTPPKAKSATRPKAQVSRSPAIDAIFGLASAAAAATKQAPGGALPRKAAARVPAKAQRPLLSLEDTIAVGSALVALRVGFTIVHIETAGSDLLRDEILSIHAMRVERRKPVAEFNAWVQLLRTLASPEAGDDDADRPPARRQAAIPLEQAMAGLCRFLGTHRQHVFAHGAASTQTLLGQAARQYGMAIENPVGDLVDLAKLAWPDQSDYSLEGMAADLLPGAIPIRTPADATKAILRLLEAASKQLTAEGGLVSRSIVHWGTSPETFQFVPSPW